MSIGVMLFLLVKWPCVGFFLLHTLFLSFFLFFFTLLTIVILHISYLFSQHFFNIWSTEKTKFMINNLLCNSLSKFDSRINDELFPKN